MNLPSTLADLPLTALRSFDAFYLTGSLRGAATSLGVTTGAVCRQLERLAARMTPRPLEKRRGRLVLTSEGRRLAEALRTGFAQLEAAHQEFGLAPAAGSGGSPDRSLTCEPAAQPVRAEPPRLATPFHATRNLCSPHDARDAAFA